MVEGNPFQALTAMKLNLFSANTELLSYWVTELLTFGTVKRAESTEDLSGRAGAYFVK